MLDGEKVERLVQLAERQHWDISVEENYLLNEVAVTFMLTS